ncbi:MAG TPA: prepilin-type N-terminal cleavage/methylation domain-containing protein [Thermoguttaceae bacterium]
MKRKITKHGLSRGFTLVEMLVVVLIIGILAGLISAAAVQARKRAKVAAIGMEISQLSLALTNYKTQFGEYPPDFFNIGTDESKAIVLRHVTRAFPRFVFPPSATTIAQKWQFLHDEINTTTNPPVDINAITLDPSTALRFWLGGMPDAQGRPIGFSKDPAHPFDTINTPTSRIGPFFDFDPGRIQTDGTYYPPGIPTGSGQPYVYFRAETGQKYDSSGNLVHGEYYVQLPVNSSNFKTIALITTVRPYWDDRVSGWVNNTSYQILCCGLDGAFGQENVYPSGRIPAGAPSDVIGTDSPSFPAGNFDHLDDQTNFAHGTIGDDLP